MDAPEKMALTIQGIMIAVSTWKTVNILMLEESEKIFTGTVTVAIPQCRTGKKILRISVFEKIECTFYQEHYGKYIEAQNERNARTRHTERNRSVEDLLKNNKTCPEETIFQIGTVEESVSYEILLAVVQDFTKQFTNRFGSHVHILDWALHLDEGTPHIHERHVFDCENKYGESLSPAGKALKN